jgi:hypothetical protein
MTAILLARRHDFLSGFNVCRTPLIDRWMRRYIRVRRAKTLVGNPSRPFRTPDRNLTIPKAIGMPIPVCVPQAMVLQSLAAG